MSEKFIDILKDIRDVKYPDIVEKSEQVSLDSATVVENVQVTTENAQITSEKAQVATENANLTANDVVTVQSTKDSINEISIVISQKAQETTTAAATVENQVNAVYIGQSAAAIGFATKADLDANLDYDDGILAIVTNDGTPSYNGTYRKEGVNGSGSWIQSSFDRVVKVEHSIIDTHIRYAVKDNGKNLCNPNDENAVIGYYLNSNGNLNQSSDYAITGYIPIENGMTLTCSVSSGGAYNCLYDENFVLVSSEGNNSSLTASSSVAYARFSTPITDLNLVQVEIGSVSTTVVPYTESYEIKNIIANIDSKFIGKIDKVFGKNLLDHNDKNISISSFIKSNGDIVDTTYDFDVTGFIKIENGQTLKANFDVGNTYSALYDDAGFYISNTAVNDNVITNNTGSSCYARFSINGGFAIGDVQVEIGTVSTYYEPFTDYAPLGDVKVQVPDRNTTVVLPSKLYFVKDFESCIYFENILFKNIDDPTQVVFSDGHNYKRLVNFKPSVATSGQSFTTSVFRSFKKGEEKTFIYDVKDSSLNNGKTVNMLTIGDSFTDIGTWNARVTSLLKADGVSVNEIGTTGTSTTKAEALSGGTLHNVFLTADSGVSRIVEVSNVTQIPQTGYPGTFYVDDNGKQWTIRGGKIDSSGSGNIVVTNFGATDSDFSSFPDSGNLTKVSGQSNKEGDDVISYTSSISAYYNPFINHSNGELDITNYITFWGFNEPDVILFQFTWNDTAKWSSDVKLLNLVSEFKDAADHVHSAYPSAKIVFSIEPFGNPYAGRDVNGKKYTVLKFVELMNEQFMEDANYNTFVHIAPSYAFMDLIYGYSIVDVSPCSKYPEVTERSGGGGVHPIGEGMEQIGECAYQVVSNII